MTRLLWGFERDGYEKAILLSGHYPNRSQYLDPALQRYKNDGGSMDVLALIENQIPNGQGDHASKYETSFMLYLHPETVDMQLRQIYLARLTMHSRWSIDGG
jgi:creatinine amidohydrolase/Fe(II)-dependent formamide hydrolase-like protein